MSQLKLSIFLIFFSLPWILGATGCPNALSEFGDKSTDNAKLFDAQTKIDQGDWTGAITSILAMTTAGQAIRETKVTLASAYAGRCGLNLMNLAKSVADGTSAGTKFWPVLMADRKAAVAANLTDCVSAEASIKAISTVATDRRPDENVLMAFIEFAKSGVVLAVSNADANDDGTVDAGFDGCSTASITDAQVQELGASLMNALFSLSASNSTVATGVTGTVQGICTTIQAMPGLSTFCAKTSPSDFDANSIKAIRALLKSNEIGFDTCGNSIGNGTCVCP